MKEASHKMANTAALHFHEASRKVRITDKVEWMLPRAEGVSEKSVLNEVPLNESQFASERSSGKDGCAM